MPSPGFNIVPTALLADYRAAVAALPLHTLAQLVDSELSIATFSFYTSVSAVYSSRIEGEDIELDAYVKHKRFGISFLPDHTQKIDDLYGAYQFAKTNTCDRMNLMAAHTMLTRHILPQGRGGRRRGTSMNLEQMAHAAIVRPDKAHRGEDTGTKYPTEEQRSMAEREQVPTEIQDADERRWNEVHRGTLRTSNMYVTTPDGRIEYVAAAPHSVEGELTKLFDDLATLRTMDLSIAEVFYFASMLHLVFVKIHPFDDGNGRCARLLEKWFLAEKLGEKAWLLQSEKHYYNNHQLYYTNIRLLGLEYDTLDYGAALPFLLMLPGSLSMNKDA